MSREILQCLRRERDIYVKTIIPSQNTAFMFTPALICAPAEKRESLLSSSSEITCQEEIRCTERAHVCGKLIRDNPGSDSIYKQNMVCAVAEKHI